ncbi:unnamed protein product [Caretta caretta]
MDYKIIVKAISLRLGSVLADVIHPDQTYTVLYRSIFDNLFMVRDLLELGRRDGLSFALLSLHQEKAFDRVDHGYLLSTLQAFGFGPQFVGFLRVLYSSAECLVKLTWTLTEQVSFRREEPELQLVLSAYADDVLLVIQDPGDLAQVEACQAIYSAASSARVNWVKSSGLAIFKTVLRTPSEQGRHKAFSTCFPHITVVSLFIFSGIFAYLKPTSSSTSCLDLMVDVFYSVVPPMMNPSIYSMRNKEIKASLRKLIGQRLFMINKMSIFLL